MSCEHQSAIRDLIEYFESVNCMGTTVFWLFVAHQFKIQEEFDLFYLQVVRTRSRKLNT